MTFAEALKQARAGKAVRHPAMGKGWVMIWLPKQNARTAGPWCRTPYTGSLTNQLTADDRMRKDWEVAE